MSVDSDLQRHQRDWKGFIRLMTICSASAAVTLALMAVFLV